jgi:hypothetical protein
MSWPILLYAYIDLEVKYIWHGRLDYMWGGG